MVTKSNPMNLKTAKPIAESLRSLGLFMEAAKLEDLAKVLDNYRSDHTLMCRAEIASCFEDFTRSIENPGINLNKRNAERFEKCKVRIKGFIVKAIEGFPATKEGGFPCSFDTELRTIMRADGGAVQFAEKVIGGLRSGSPE